jgi:hypothetical protein
VSEQLLRAALAVVVVVVVQVVVLQLHALDRAPPRSRRECICCLCVVMSSGRLTIVTQIMSTRILPSKEEL